MGKGLPVRYPCHIVAAFLLQECQLSLGLHPFGKDRSVQAVPERDNGADDGHGMMIVFQVANRHSISGHRDFVRIGRVSAACSTP